MSVTIENKISALEYAIAKLFRLELNKGVSKEALLLKNNFNQDKLKLLPYFLYTANGHREEMSKIFDSFVVSELGVIESDISASLGLFKNITFDEINDKIVDIDLDFTYENCNFNIEGIKFNKAFDAIDHSIDAYKINNWCLFNFSDSQLSEFAKKGTAWVIIESLSDILEDKAVPLYMLNEERSVFANDPSQRVLSY